MNRIVVPVPNYVGVWEFPDQKGKKVKVAVLVCGAVFDPMAENRERATSFDAATDELRGDWLICLCDDGKIRRVMRDTVRVEIPSG